MRKKGYRLMTALCLMLTACASPLEVAQRTAAARRTPTATPNLSIPVISPQPVGQPTPNPGEDANGQPLCSHISRGDSLPAVLWDDPRQQYHFQPIDPENGQPQCGSAPLPLEQYLDLTVSPDQKIMATFNYHDEYYQDGSLTLVDLNSLEAVTTTVRVNSEINSMAFNRDGNLLAFALQPRSGPQASTRCPLYLLDLKTRKVTDTVLLDFIPRFMRFTANGKWLAIYGSTGGGDTEQQPSAYALLLWSNHLGLAWKQELNILDGSFLVGPKDQEKALVTWSPGLVYLPDQDILYLVSADEDKFTRVDYINRVVEAKDIHPAPVSFLEQLVDLTASPAQARAMSGVQKQVVLSGDRSRLFITGLATNSSSGTSQPGLTTGSLGLQVVDLKTADQIAHLDTKAIDIQASPDGKYLYLRSWEDGEPSTDVLVANTLEAVAHLPGQSLVTTRTFADQDILLSVQEGTTESQISLIDPLTFKQMFTWPAAGKPVWLTF
jgi:hypothetical protein